MSARLFALLLLITSGASAQSPPPETVIVTGVSEPLPLAEADRDVSLLPLPERERPLFDSWFNLLQLDSALDLRQRTPGGFLADLSIRGATFGQTLVLLNGMRINDAQTGHFNLDLPVPLETITSLEVLKGSGSTFYGSDAIGGVVNVRTQPLAHPELRLLAGLGNFGTNQQHAIASFGGAHLSEEVAIARDFSSGFAPNRDYRNLALTSLSSYSTKRGPGSVLLAYSDRPYGADQFYGSYPSWERIKTWFASLHQDIGKRTEASFAYRRHTDLFVLVRDNPRRYTNRHLLETWQANLRRHNDLPIHAVLSYGAEGLGEAITSTNLGQRQRTRGSAYAFYDVRALHRFGFSAGIREEVYGSHQVATSPTASGTAWLSSRLKARASVSRAFRLPSYTDLYYSDPANLGNPNLKPESALSYEAGLDAHLSPRLRASVTAFQRRDRNGIDYVRATPNDLWRATNFNRLNFAGLEAAAEYEASRHQHLRLSFTSLRGSLAASTILSSKYAFSYPSQNGVMEWRADLAGKLIARTRIGVVNRVARDPYAVWDFSATYATGHVRPFLQFTNLTNTVYQDLPGVLTPTRGIFGGLELLMFGSAH